MVDRLLIVPESLASQSFAGCALVSRKTIGDARKSGREWPRIGDLQQLLAERKCDSVAVTFETDAGVVQQLVTALQETRPKEMSSIVFADDPVPADLKAMFPSALLPCVLRLTTHDLISVTAETITTCSADFSLPAAAIRSNVNAVFITGSSSPDRFPEAGPACHGLNCGLTPKDIEFAVKNAISDLRLTNADQKCVTAGILLLWDFLDESHEISQTLEGRGNPRTADYWHGIMHRREPDAGNASYWFRRVGMHPAFDSLAAHLNEWLLEIGASEVERQTARITCKADSQFDPFAMIELSTRALRKPGELDDTTLRKIQYLEILNLLASVLHSGS